jgi:acyl-CoA synthetase (AMP-forming)/AMP-acid ligase II
VARLIEFKTVAPLPDRESDTIMRDGSPILLAEVERALTAHPMVQDAAAFGVPDPMLGHRLAAVVQLENESDDAIIDEILAMARVQLPEHKLPELLTAVDAVPRDPFGNIDRRTIAESILGNPTGLSRK